MARIVQRLNKCAVQAHSHVVVIPKFQLQFYLQTINNYVLNANFNKQELCSIFHVNVGLQNTRSFSDGHVLIQPGSQPVNVLDEATDHVVFKDV